ncbi:MAG: ABC transporter permease [Chitinispirillaceae bacterium]|nr:ABC transporter permease [Chitinispirillaceae bacterium]
MSDLGSAVCISLYTSTVATSFCAAAGIPLGCAIALHSFPGKRLVVGLLNTLLSLPTVVVGLLGYMLLCRSSPLGSLHLLFTPEAIIIGEFILALPIMIVFTHAAVAAVDPAAQETARLLGAKGFRLFFLMVSEARFGIMAAVAAVFGRLIGEVGIAMMLGGNIAGFTRNMTTTIALEASKGEVTLGLKLGGILLLLAVSVNLVLRYLQGRATS